VGGGPTVTDAPRVQLARTLFAGLGPTYDRYARLLSLGQDPRWRRFLVSRMDVGPGDTVLDVATGTAAVALELVRRTGCRVVGLDQSPGMLEVARDRIARAGFSDRIELLEGRAERLPFPDGRFDGVSFTYLLRYVENPAATLHELARVTRSGGTVASLEFGVPPARMSRVLWEVYVRVALPLAGRAISREWHRVGQALGPTIRALPPPERIASLWGAAGIEHVQIRRLSLGGGVVMWGRRQ
jgi:demethylmenaquinone methyltransferase/2-methoxy-6-polyprenyl-1,4-benzoquinol methylase